MIPRCIQQTCGFLDGWFLCKGPGGEICLWRSALCGGSSRLVVAHWAEPRSPTPPVGKATQPNMPPPAHLMQQPAASAAMAAPAPPPPAPAGLVPDRAAVILVPWCFAICSSSDTWFSHDQFRNDVFQALGVPAPWVASHPPTPPAAPGCNHLGLPPPHLSVNHPSQSLSFRSLVIAFPPP